MSEHVLTDYPPPPRSYVDSINPETPRFNPYVIRREGRLLLAIPGDDQQPVRTFELEPDQLTRLLVGGHEALSGYLRQVQVDVEILDCLTCKGDSEICASLPSLRHCEKATREGEAHEGP